MYKQINAINRECGFDNFKINKREESYYTIVHNMEPADTIETIKNMNSSNLHEENKADTNKAKAMEFKENMSEDHETTSSVDGDDENMIADDQECIAIEEVVNKTIELDEDSSEELELQENARTEVSPSVRDNSPAKATEFVIVNAANLSIAVVANEMESANKCVMGDLQLKDELTETVTADLNTNDVLENDPMDLLELNNRSECSSSVKSAEDTYNDDVSSVGSSSVKTGSSSSVSVMDWIKDYPWLLYEEGDDPFGYCLYCDTKINVKAQSPVKQHGMSLYHNERCENYLAFREEEEKNGLGMKLIEIKEEFGTDSRVEALKLKRKSQSVALNNFNWRRWLEEYSWLERNSTEGTVGFCKYCRIHVNVEFSYLRDRHQEGNRHKEAEKHYGESNQTEVQNEPSGDNEEDENSAADNNRGNSYRWLEMLKKETNMVLCKLCGIKMFKNNFLRHLGSNLHKHNEDLFLQKNGASKKELSSKNTQNWKSYSRYHPWLVSDPLVPTIAYCKYCEKRFYYGSSASKRLRHENSSHHKQNEIEFKKRSRNMNSEKKDNRNNSKEDDEQDSKDQVERRQVEEDEEQSEESEENEEVDGDAKEDNKGENQDKSDEEEISEEGKTQDEKGTEDDNESKKRISKLSDEWLNQYPWCIKYKRDPKNFIFCIYCNIPLSVSYSRLKHQSTSFHISAEKKFLSQQNKKKTSQSNETLPFYDWVVTMKNNSNYSCRYCRVRISKNYSKKQHAASKVHQINETIYNNNRRMSLRNDETDEKKVDIENDTSNVTSTKKMQTFNKVVIKTPSTVTLIKQMQKRFDWLSYKRNELRSHYGHCKICDCSVYIRSVKHVLRHLRSGRHIRIMKAIKTQKAEEDPDNNGDGMSEKLLKRATKEEMETSPSPTANGSQNQSSAQAFEFQMSCNYKSTIIEMKKRYSWVEKSEIANYAYCRFCNLNIPLKIIFLRNHSNSPKHRRCVVNSHSVDKKTVNKRNFVTKNIDLDDNDDMCDDVDNDVIIVEDNNEEILISEQDENWTVKSEIMDEHEELDYLLQRSWNNNLNTSNMQRNVRKPLNDDSGISAKRVKRSQSFRRLNDSNSSLVASLLTTPLTLASCLGPFIQQQIQQQTNLSQAVQPIYNAPTAPDPEVSKIATISVFESENSYDLFFKSISETVKKLPVDLAAEGKLRVMQIICDLELQALNRKQCERSELGSTILNAQEPSPSNMISVCSSNIANDTNTEQILNGNEPIITRLNMNKEHTVSSPSTSSVLPAKTTNEINKENPTTSPDSSPVIGLMDKNGLQTLQFRTSVANPSHRTPTCSTINSIANSGIRCIPFKNLSQSSASDSSNSKTTRIQVPINIQSSNTTPNSNSVNNSKSLINFRNLQITQRIGTPPKSATPSTVTQQTAQKTTSVTNKSPQKNFITNIQPQLQRWGCSVNGASTHHNPSSPAVNPLQKLSSQQTSTPISKK